MNKVDTKWAKKFRIFNHNKINKRIKKIKQNILAE